MENYTCNIVFIFKILKTERLFNDFFLNFLSFYILKNQSSWMQAQDTSELSVRLRSTGKLVFVSQNQIRALDQSRKNSVTARSGDHTPNINLRPSPRHLPNPIFFVLPRIHAPFPAAGRRQPLANSVLFVDVVGFLIYLLELSCLFFINSMNILKFPLYAYDGFLISRLGELHSLRSRGRTLPYLLASSSLFHQFIKIFKFLLSQADDGFLIYRSGELHSLR